VKTTSTTAGSAGTYAKDVTSTVNVAGGDRIEAIYTASSGDVLGVSEITPMVQVWVGRSQFGGHLLSGTGGTVTLRTSAGTFRGSGPISFDGIDLETLHDSSVFRNAGTPKTARVGDRVSSALQSNMSFKIPNLTIHVDSATDVISGACPAGRSLMWTVADSGNVIALNVATCSGAGSYSIDTTADHDIGAGERVEVTARLATGDRVAIRRIAA
jgi:putative ubiquitin-RnfH superfamily antitoxin RatB of RatAB toxin-antitoxin module